MSAIFNQTNLNPNTTFWQAGGGAAYPDGITVGNNPPVKLDNFGIFGSDPLAAINSSTGDLTDFQASAFHAGEPNTGYVSVTETGMTYTAPSTGVPSQIMSVSTIAGVNQIALTNISTINGRALASPVYSSTISLSGSPQVNVGQLAGISTILTGLPVGPNVSAAAQLTVAPPTGSNVEGILWMGMGFSTSGTLLNLSPLYFNTANAQQTASFQMNGIVPINSSSDQLIITLSNGATNAVIGNYACSQIKLINQ